METRNQVLLRSELTYLESCVRLVLNFKETTGAGGPTVTRASLQEQLGRCMTELKERLTKEVFGSAKDHAVRRYVQFHQAGLVTMSDEIFAKLRTVNDLPVPGKSELLIYALEAIEALSRLIEKQFYAYYDSRHPLSNFRCDAVTRGLRTEVEGLAPLLRTSGIGETLQKVLFDSMEDALASARSQSLDREQISYLEGLLQDIRNFLKIPQSSDLNFGDLLYRKNFNSTEFEGWFRDQILVKANGQREVNFSPVNQEKGIATNRRPIDILLKEWYKEQLKTDQPKEKSMVRTLKVMQLPLHLSVPQLALFVRLCYLEGCFQITNISTIMRFFTEHFETKKQLHISIKSFGKAFYATDQSTAAAVRDYLQRMIGLIDKNYFPKT